MPRGRFISKSFYDNNRLNSLPIQCHHLFGGIDVVCADREGRCKGQAKWINNQVFALRDYSDKQVEAWLNLLWQAKDDETGLGLIERYTLNGRPYIWIPGFDKHQKGRHKDREAQSDIPPCPSETMPVSASSITQKDIKTDEQVPRMIKYYEDELGITCTPMDYERLKDFADNYPVDSFKRAVDEAKKNNARSPMSYIQRIMEHWREKEKPPETSSDNQGIRTI